MAKFGLPLLDPLHIALDRPPQAHLANPVPRLRDASPLLHLHPYTYYGAVRPNCKAFIETRSKFQQ